MGTVPLRRNKQFLLLWTGVAVSTVGSRASAIAYPLLVLSFTGSSTLAGWVSFFAIVPNLLLYLPGGVLVDRWDWRRVMLVSELGRGVSIVTIVITVLCGSPYLLVVILMAVFIEGSLGVLYALAEKVAVRSVVPASQVTNALANNEARAHMALLLGRSLGGVLFGLGRVVPFVADVASFVLSLATLIPLRNRRSVPRSRRLNLPGDVVAGFKWLRSQPYFLFATIVSAALNCTAAALVLIYMTVAQGEGTDPFLIGLVVAIPGLSGIVGAGIAPSAYRLIGSRLLLIQVWVWMSALLPTLFLVNSISIGIVLAFGGFVGALVDVAVHSSLFSAVPEGMLARVASIDSLFGFLGVAVGPLAGGYLTQWFGMRGAVSALFIVMAGMAVLVTCSRAVRNPLTSIANH